MATKIVDNNKVQTSPRTKKEAKELQETRKASKVSTIIISLLITFIIGYITVDYFVINKKIDNKVIIVNQKFDSLKVYLDEKLPMIDNAIEIQKQQLQELQNMSPILSKK